MASLQKKLAAKVLKCGVRRVWIEPKNEKVKQAITRRDIRRFIKEGIIKKLPEKKRATLGEKIQQRAGSRKGAKGAREGKKNMWFRIIRPQRKMLKELRPMMQPLSYRKTYKMVKGNVFRSRAHLLSYLKDNKLLIEKKAK